MFGKKKAEEVKQDDSQQKQETSEKKRSGVISVVMISIMAAIFIAVALIMLFVKDATVTYICYAICGAAIIVGIFAIVRYFLIKAYCDLNEYGFAEGVLLVSLGICGLIKVDAIAGVFITVVGIALLISGVIKLQSALALRMMNDVLWFLVLIISVVIIGFSMFVLLKPDMDQIYTWYVLLADGVLSLINVIYQFFRIKAYNSAEMKAVEQSKNDMRDKILKEQEDMRLAKEEQRKAELEQKAAEDKALEAKLNDDDAKYGFNAQNSEPVVIPDAAQTIVQPEAQTQPVAQTQPDAQIQPEAQTQPAAGAADIK